LIGNNDAAPPFDDPVPVDVLAISEISEGLAPSVKEAPHAVLRPVASELEIKPGKFLLTTLYACLVQSLQVTFLGIVELPDTILGMMVIILLMLSVPTEFWMSVRSSVMQRALADVSFRQTT